MLNKFIGIGRNTKDGEYRTSDNDLKIYANTLAITNNFKNKNGNYDSEFINYVAYRNTAEYLNKYSSKGTLINIEGRIHTRSYEDKDKNKKYITEIIVENASVLEKVKQEDKQDNIQEEVEIPQNTTSEYDNLESDIQLTPNDLPF